jgi:hypothetical protein
LLRIVSKTTFLGSIVLASTATLQTRLKLFAGLTTFYGLFIGAYAYAFECMDARDCVCMADLRETGFNSL